MVMKHRLWFTFMCKVHANINYFLLYYEMKYDIKPERQLIVKLKICCAWIIGNASTKTEKEEILCVIWDSRKEEKWILILRVNALFLEK